MIHFIFGTQRPTADIIPKSVSTHCTLRLGLATSSAVESQNIIEESGLELIRADQKGRGIVKNGNLTKFQAYFITDKKIESICKKHWVEDSNIKVNVTSKKSNKEVIKNNSHSKEDLDIAENAIEKIEEQKMASPKMSKLV